MTNNELLALLEEVLGDSAKILAQRAKSGEINSSEIKAALVLYKEAGGSLVLPGGEKHPMADEILQSMADIDLAN